MQVQNDFFYEGVASIPQEGHDDSKVAFMFPSPNRWVLEAKIRNAMDIADKVDLLITIEVQRISEVKPEPKPVAPENTEPPQHPDQ